MAYNLIDDIDNWFNKHIGFITVTSIVLGGSLINWGLWALLGDNCTNASDYLLAIMVAIFIYPGIALLLAFFEECYTYTLLPFVDLFRVLKRWYQSRKSIKG